MDEPGGGWGGGGEGSEKTDKTIKLGLGGTLLFDRETVQWPASQVIIL